MRSWAGCIPVFQTNPHIHPGDFLHIKKIPVDATDCHIPTSPLGRHLHPSWFGIISPLLVENHMSLMVEIPHYIWLVVLTLLKNISQLGWLFPYIMENKKCSKPPTSKLAWSINFKFGIFPVIKSSIFRQHHSRTGHVKNCVLGHMPFVSLIIHLRRW